MLELSLFFVAFLLSRTREVLYSGKDLVITRDTVKELEQEYILIKVAKLFLLLLA